MSTGSINSHRILSHIHIRSLLLNQRPMKVDFVVPSNCTLHCTGTSSTPPSFPSPPSGRPLKPQGRTTSFRYLKSREIKGGEVPVVTGGYLGPGSDQPSSTVRAEECESRFAGAECIWKPARAPPFPLSPRFEVSPKLLNESPSFQRGLSIVVGYVDFISSERWGGPR